MRLPDQGPGGACTDTEPQMLHQACAACHPGSLPATVPGRCKPAKLSVYAHFKGLLSVPRHHPDVR